MLKGLNHITLAVSDLNKSFDFYVNTLKFNPKVKWNSGAYLSLDDLWLCLSKGDVCPSQDYSHIAFTINDNEFDEFCDELISKKVKLWKTNTSEGKSLYVIDPDNHKLEIHAGDLESRLNSLKIKPYQDLQWF